MQLLCSATTAPRAQPVRCLLLRISDPSPYLKAYHLEAAPDRIIPPLMPLLLRRDDPDISHVAAVTLLHLAANASNSHKIMEAGAIAPLVRLLQSSSERMHLPAAQALAFLAEDRKMSAPPSSPLELSPTSFNCWPPAALFLYG